MLSAVGEGEGVGEGEADADGDGDATGEELVLALEPLFELECDDEERGVGVGVLPGGSVNVYDALGNVPFQTLWPDVLSISEPFAKATLAFPAPITEKLTVAIAWMPLWATVAAQARLTVLAVCEF